TLIRNLTTAPQASLSIYEYDRASRARRDAVHRGASVVRAVFQGDPFLARGGSIVSVQRRYEPGPALPGASVLDRAGHARSPRGHRDHVPAGLPGVQVEPRSRQRLPVL